MQFRRVRAILDELRLELRERRAVRSETAALTLLGRTVATAGDITDSDLLRSLTRVLQEQRKLSALDQGICDSLEADRIDYTGSPRWLRPVVVLRGLCARAILRDQIAQVRKALALPEAEIGKAVVDMGWVLDRYPEQVKVVVHARATHRAVMEEKRRLLGSFGGSVLPQWFPHLRREGAELGHSLWLQLKPNVLPRASALVGLTVGWWLANTYTDSHFRSVLHSLGIGSGGKRVVSGETYKAMMFWLPIFAAAVFAYLADRAHFVIQRRYTRPTPPP
jgi:hypothetical protein